MRLNIRNKLLLIGFSFVFVFLSLFIFVYILFLRSSEVLVQTSEHVRTITDFHYQLMYSLQRVHHVNRIDTGDSDPSLLQWQLSRQEAERLLEELSLTTIRPDAFASINESAYEVFNLEEDVFSSYNELANIRKDFDAFVATSKAFRHDHPLRVKNETLELELLLSQVGYYDKEYLFQYSDKEHADELLQSIERARQYGASVGEDAFLQDLAQYKKSVDDLIKKIEFKNQIDAHVASLELVLDGKLASLDILVSSYLDTYTSLYENAILSNQHTFSNTLYIYSIGSIFLLGLFVLFAHKLTSPIYQLIKEVREFSTGNFSRRVKVRTNDELGELADTFNAMGGQMQKFYTDLETNNAQLLEKINEIKNLSSVVDNRRKAILNILEDVSSTSRQLEQERNKLQITLASIGDGALVMDQNGIVTFFNSVATTITGYSATEAVGKHYSELLQLYTEGDKTKYNHGFIQEAMEKGIITKMTNHTVLRRKDGEYVPVADSAAPIKDEIGVISGCIIIFRDVTYERDLDRMKTEFISLASHQLRTPLSAIRWFLEMLLSGDGGALNEEQQDFVQSSYDSALRMNDLVNGLLNVSRIESERLSIKPEPLKIKDYLDKVVAGIQPLIIKKKHQLDIQITTKSDSFISDAGLLQEIISNLLSNAIKYTPEKGKIDLSVVDDPQKEGFLLFSIKDNGVGVPDADKSKLFQKFSRAENAREADTEGSGLGLYIVKRLVGLLGGNIGFTSTEGTGSTFYFNLPIKGVAKKVGDRNLA